MDSMQGKVLCSSMLLLIWHYKNLRYLFSSSSLHPSAPVAVLWRLPSPYGLHEQAETEPGTLTHLLPFLDTSRKVAILLPLPSLPPEQ